VKACTREHAVSLQDLISHYVCFLILCTFFDKYTISQKMTFLSPYKMGL